jgi:hypothetical protein
MAIFRATRVGGVALFRGDSVAPPVVIGTKARFQAMRSLLGVALFRGAPGGVVVDPVDPGYTPQQFSEELSLLLSMFYEAGDSNAFEDTLNVAFGMGYAAGSDVSFEDTLDIRLALTYDAVVQTQVEDLLESRVFLDFTTRARLRGWNDDTPLPPRDWIPDPKPNLF